MTRETKVGLLVGLGFILVFAVVLSHTGSMLSVGGDNALANRSNGGSTSLTEVTMPPSGTSLSDSRPPVSVSPAARSVAPRPVVGDRTPAPMPRRDSRVGLSPLAELPTPSVLGLGPAILPNHTTGPVGPLKPIETVIASADDGRQTVPERRVAPPAPLRPAEIEEPKPSTPAAAPTVSPSPSDTPQPASPSMPPPRSPITKDYIVQKGDTLGAIAKSNYGTASMKVVEFVATANKANGVKDAHNVREGQKLVLPPLPPELAAMVEPAGSIDVSRMTGDVRTVATQEMAATLRSGSKKDEGRKAPTGQVTRRENPTLTRQTPKGDAQPSGVAETNPVPAVEIGKPSSSVPPSQALPPAGTASKLNVPTLTKRVLAPALTALTSPKAPTAPTATATPAPAAPTATPAPPALRTYEIRANDTLMSIAAQQLGSGKRWSEIQKINRDLDPKRMKPGVKIKLPGKNPQSTSDGSTKAKRVAA